ncbi:MAG: ABC transporter ATP-binding protein [Dehalococcoidia bacterium]
MMKSNSSVVISVKDLYKTYGAVTAVNGISFEVKQGEVFGMLGPNGAGKTTTVEIIEGIRIYDRGTVTVLGMDVRRNVRSVKERIGVQPQTPALFPTLTVREVVDFFRNLYNRSIPASEAIELVAMEPSEKVLVKNLSGGQQQRLSVALAFVNDPDIIFLDEPTTGLDPQARRAMWEVIEKYRNTGKTIFLTTHYMEEAERLCDRVAIMDHGEIISLGTPRQMIDRNFRESAIQFKIDGHPGHDIMTELPGVTGVAEEDEEVIIYTENISATIPALLELASSSGTELTDMSIRQATLEDVFLKLTGKRIRD